MLRFKKNNLVDLNVPMIGILGEKEEAKDGYISLDEIDTKIGKIRLQRSTLLGMFLDDLNVVIKKIKSDYKLKMNPKKLLYGNYLDLNFVSDENSVNALVSKDNLEHISEENRQVEFIIAKSMPVIQRLFRVFEEEESILSNEFYEEVPVYLDNYLQKLIVSADGINLLMSDLNKTLTEDEKMYLISYFYYNYNKILKKILVLDDTIFDRYETNLDDRKILTLYRGKK